MRGMAAADNIAKGEILVSLPVAAALVVSPKERSQLPGTFCSSVFYSKKPWYCLPPVIASSPSKDLGFDLTAHRLRKVATVAVETYDGIS